MSKPACYFWLVAAAAQLLACAPRPLAPSPSGSKSSPRELSQHSPVSSVEEASPRLFPPLDGAATLSVGEDRDGSERLIAYGLRVLARPSGALEQAQEYLPVARGAQSLELPSRLGGGFLFYVLSSSATLFFRAATFTGSLTPFARIDFEAEQVVAGFDRLYVISRHPERLIALDAEHGTGLGLGALPASPSYGKMAFVDGWFGAVQVPFRGTLVTFDAGGAWRPLSGSVRTIAVEDGELRMSGPDGSQALDADGRITRRDAPEAPVAMRETEVAQALRAAVQPNGQAPSQQGLGGQQGLKLAVLRGFRGAKGSLVMASAGKLVRVRASDGELLEVVDQAYAGAGDCNALAYGRGFGFVCNDEGSGQTMLYAFTPPFRLQPVRAFAGARYVSASGNGALVIRGSCGAVGPRVGGAYCIADADGAFREIRVRGDLGAERVTALADGRVAVIVPPRLGAQGFLSLIERSGEEQRRPLKWQKDVPGVALLEKGLWLDGVVERSSGGLAGWVVGSEPFAGVRVALDGTVTVGAPESSIDRALLSGVRALIVGRTGRAIESTDGGFEWSAVDLPSEFDATRELRDDARWQGCSEVGCAFDGFVRVGWKNGSAAPRLPIAALPSFTPLPEAGGGRWRLRCEATGQVSEPALPVSTRARSSGRSEDNAVAPWTAFFEAPAPKLAAGEVGFDAAGSDSEAAALHAYAWGELGADWGRVGHTQLRAFDRFDLSHAAFQSAIMRSQWPDANMAAEAMGLDSSGTPTSWRAVLETGQRAAAVLTSARGLLDLLLFEEGKTVTRIPNAARLGLGMLNSVAKLGDAWYAGSFDDNRAFTLTRIAGNRVDRLAAYPDVSRDQGSVFLVRSLDREELAVWVIARGWYLYPIDAKSFTVRAPFYRSPIDLAEVPEPCAGDEQGFLLSGSPTLEPTLRFSRPPEELSVRRLEGQFVWSARGLCTRALAAETDSPSKRSAELASSFADATTAKQAIPLTVTERRPLGRRVGYSCSRP